MRNDLRIDTKCIFFNLRLFLFLAATAVCCSLYTTHNMHNFSIRKSQYKQSSESTLTFEASAISEGCYAYVEIATAEPNLISGNRNNLFLNFPSAISLKKSAFRIIDINLLSYIRKDYIYLSILRI